MSEAGNRQEFDAYVKDIHTYYGRKATQPVLDLWWVELGTYPDAAINAACRLWCRRNRTVPTIEEFEEFLMNHLRGSGFNKGFRPNADIEAHWADVRPMLMAKNHDAVSRKLTDLRESNRGVWNAIYWRINDWLAEYLGSDERRGRFLWMVFGHKESDPACHYPHPYTWSADELHHIFRALPENKLSPPPEYASVAAMPDLSDVAVVPEIT